jgi:glutaredoxin
MPDLKVYGAPRCPDCRRAKKFRNTRLSSAA